MQLSQIQYFEKLVLCFVYYSNPDMLHAGPGLADICIVPPLIQSSALYHHPIILLGRTAHGQLLFIHCGNKKLPCRFLCDRFDFEFHNKTMVFYF